MTTTANSTIQNLFNPDLYFTSNLSVFPVRVGESTLAPPEKWQNWCNYIPSQVVRDGWKINQWQHPESFSVGLATGKVYDISNRLICLDIDHPDLVACLSYLFPSPCARFGSKGLGVFYRVDKDNADLKKSQNFTIPNKGSPAVEFLSLSRFTFIPPSAHRKTGKPYQWRGKPLLEVLDQLPELTTRDLRIIKAITSLNTDGATIETIIAGEATHSPTLALVASLVSLGLEPDKIVGAVSRLFPDDYKGDSVRQIPEMVESAIRKGFDKKQDRPSDGDIDDEELTEIFADWHYVSSINRMVNSADKRVFDKERFEATMGNRLKRAMAIYVSWPERSVKSKVTYMPAGQPVMDDAINMWRPTDLNPKYGDVKPWLMHLAMFYPESEILHMLDWLAHTLQKSHIKAGHAILMGSKYEGIGKDLWLLPVRAAFGKHNVSEIGADSLSSQFNEWLAHKHLIIVQEIWSGSRRELSNQLKPLLSSPPDEIMVNEKGIARYAIPNICASIMLTNHKDAVSMASEDRRYFVMWTEEKPQDPSYYTAFANWVIEPENQSHVYHYLLHRDISKFNIKAPPPKTTAKMDMVDATMTRAESLVAVIRDILREAPLKDIVSENGVYAMLLDTSTDIAREVVRVPKTSPRYPIRLALKDLSYEKLEMNAVKKIGGKVHQFPVYCLPESRAKYLAMKPVEIYDIVSSALDF